MKAVNEAVYFDDDFSSGVTKIFLRTHQSHDLESAREDALVDVATKVQRVARKYICYSRYKTYVKIIADIKEAIKLRGKTDRKDYNMIITVFSHR
jgi:myosin heavy subunit